MLTQARPQLGRTGAWVWAVVVGIVTALISLARLITTRSNALESVLFAEDGIFPLCVAKADALTCLVDPYAGYFIFLPRVLAIPVAGFPIETWALASNITAAVSVGALALVSFLSLVRWGLSPLWSTLVALVPVAAPIVGFEAINVYASIYMPLMFTMTIVLVTWTPDRRPWLPAIGVLITALTIPSAVVLLIPLAVIVWRRLLSLRDALIVGFGSVAGLIVQLVVSLTADNPRPIAVSFDSLRGWVDNVPVALTTVWPGLSFGPAPIFGIFTTPVQTATGWLVVAVMAGVGIWLLVRPSLARNAIGSMILVGLATGAIPTVIGYASNRYFVIPVLLWVAAGLVALGSHAWRRPTLAWALTLVLLVFAWWPAFGASEWRASATPPWKLEANRLVETCRADPGAVVDVLFTPDWPMPHIEVTEPTTNRVPCLSLGLWRE